MRRAAPTVSSLVLVLAAVFVASTSASAGLASVAVASEPATVAPSSTSTAPGATVAVGAEEYSLRLAAAEVREHVGDIDVEVLVVLGGWSDEQVKINYRLLTDGPTKLTRANIAADVPEFSDLPVALRGFSMFIDGNDRVAYVPASVIHGRSLDPHDFYAIDLTQPERIPPELRSMDIGALTSNGIGEPLSEAIAGRAVAGPLVAIAGETLRVYDGWRTVREFAGPNRPVETGNAQTRVDEQYLVTRDNRLRLLRTRVESPSGTVDMLQRHRPVTKDVVVRLPDPSRIVSLDGDDAPDDSSFPTTVTLGPTTSTPST